jgi:hypothetical protein
MPRTKTTQRKSDLPRPPRKFFATQGAFKSAPGTGKKKSFPLVPVSNIRAAASAYSPSKKSQSTKKKNTHSRTSASQAVTGSDRQQKAVDSASASASAASTSASASAASTPVSAASVSVASASVASAAAASAYTPPAFIMVKLPIHNRKRTYQMLGDEESTGDSNKKACDLSTGRALRSTNPSMLFHL